MFANLHRRLSAEAGAGQVAVIGIALVLCALVVAAFALSTGTSGGLTSGARDTAAQRTALQASEAASQVGDDRGGSFAAVSLLSVHKLSLVPIRRRGSQPWLSAATGTAHTYSVTVTAPDGNTYTITKATDGSLSGTCHVVAGADAGSGCLHTDASGAGVW